MKQIGDVVQLAHFQSLFLAAGMIQIVLEQAETEFSESVAYYESKEPGLGVRFSKQTCAAEVIESDDPAPLGMLLACLDTYPADTDMTCTGQLPGVFKPFVPTFCF